MAPEIHSIEPTDDSQTRDVWVVFAGVFVGWQRNLRKDFGDAELNLREDDAFPPNWGVCLTVACEPPLVYTNNARWTIVRDKFSPKLLDSQSMAYWRKLFSLNHLYRVFVAMRAVLVTCEIGLGQARPGCPILTKLGNRP